MFRRRKAEVAAVMEGAVVAAAAEAMEVAEAAVAEAAVAAEGTGVDMAAVEAAVMATAAVTVTAVTAVARAPDTPAVPHPPRDAAAHTQSQATIMVYTVPVRSVTIAACMSVANRAMTNALTKPS